tara:strand:+ start:1611 stop:1793 length:183 start_codon:yes stop_codon:yes gene_type:complete
MWKTIIQELPNDNQIVWIRVLNIYGELAIATYIANKQHFISSVTEVEIPVYQVSRWKPYN